MTSYTSRVTIHTITMYGSPTFNAMVTSSSREKTTTPQIMSFYVDVLKRLEATGSTSYVTEEVFRSMQLPPSNVVNVCLGIYAQGLLFLAMMADANFERFLPEDVRAVRDFQKNLSNKIQTATDGTMDARELSFYKRDVVPLLGHTSRQLLLSPV